MWYGYRRDEQQDWVKMKEFDSLDDFYNYIEKKHISNAMCCDFEVDLQGKALIKWDKH